MTWLFVTTIPFWSIIKPDPKAVAFLSVGRLNSLNISSNGEPGGNWKFLNGLDVVLIVCVLAILTTEGISFSARSAKELGTVLLCTNDVGELNKIKIKLKFAILLKIFINLTL